MAEPRPGTIAAEFLHEVRRGSGTAAEVATRLGHPRDYGNVYLGQLYRKGMIARTESIPAVYYAEALPGNG